RDNCRYVRLGLATHGVRAGGETDSHIVPILIGDPGATTAIGASLAEQGFLVGAVRPPTVAPGTSRLRVTVSAAHTREQIDHFVNTLAAVLELATTRRR